MRMILDHVSFTYQPGTPFATDALKDINVTVEQGEYLALIGHTGSGKSTLIQHINGLMKPTAGQVLCENDDGTRNDINEKGYNRRELRRHVGMVFQYPENQLFEETIFKDVAFGPKNLGLDKEEIDRRVPEALRKVGLDPDQLRDRSPFELSGGQMRRVAIAGVLAMKPDMLILDEPAAGLDPASREEMLQLIGRLHEEGTTIVMVSHNMDDVARWAGRIVVMHRGTVAMDGTPEQVFSRAEELEKMGLDVPQACRLSILLRQAGFDFPPCYLEEDALPALLRLCKGGDAL